jgi:hypothetical protein
LEIENAFHDVGCFEIMSVSCRFWLPFLTCDIRGFRLVFLAPSTFLLKIYARDETKPVCAMMQDLCIALLTQSTHATKQDSAMQDLCIAHFGIRC